MAEVAYSLFYEAAVVLPLVCPSAVVSAAFPHSQVGYNAIDTSMVFVIPWVHRPKAVFLPHWILEATGAFPYHRHTSPYDSREMLL